MIVTTADDMRTQKSGEEITRPLGNLFLSANFEELDLKERSLTNLPIHSVKTQPQSSR